MTDNNALTKKLYFVTTTVVFWIDIFTRPTYKHIIIDALNYCQEGKGLEIYAWVLMPNHLHMIISTKDEEMASTVIRDFKKFTSKEIMKTLESDVQESRREWMMRAFTQAGTEDRKNQKYRFWQEGYHPEQISSWNFYLQKLNYIHQNPVKAEIVSRPQDYLYSSAIDYAGDNGLLKVIIAG